VRALACAVAAALVLPGCAGRPRGPHAKVTLSEYRIAPEPLEVRAGTVTFDVHNAGREVHEFEIFLGGRLVEEVEDVTPGLTRELRATLRPGSYETVCKLPGHEERGMKAGLAVR
jgi:iron uptake system component EfeO